MSPRVDVSMSDDQIREFLEQPRTAVLSTNGRDGFPHAAAMWFSTTFDKTPGFQMWAYRKSQKIVNLRRDPRCAFMTEQGDSYDTLRGILARGHARLTDDEDEVYAIGVSLYERYTLPATGIAVSEGAEVELRRQAAKRTGIVLEAERLASWDHSKL